MRLQFSKFYSPDDTPGSAGTTSDEKETIELLNEEPDEVLDITPSDKKERMDGTEETTEETDEDAEKSEEIDELADIEEELKGPKEEDLELTTPVRRRE